jgi:hypothetical protein
MLQESVSWDPQYLIREPSISFKIYILFLVVVGGWTVVRLAKIWWAAPPFRTSRTANQIVYVNLLRRSSLILSHWIVGTFLAWGFLISTTLYGLSRGMMNEKVTARAVILFEVSDFATASWMALLVSGFVFLVRWHILLRLDRHH